MAESETPVFLVDGYSDPALLRINGRASYLNAAPVTEFFKQMLEAGKRDVVVDFANCTAMDSTFLGILAGAAMQFRKHAPDGCITLVRLGKRNLELVRNLGLHRILDVDCDSNGLRFTEGRLKEIESNSETKHASAEGMLKAHENLVEADKGNLKKFQDVISFLRIQVDKDRATKGSESHA